MKSKSFDLLQAARKNEDKDRAASFAHLYKTTAETLNILSESQNTNDIEEKVTNSKKNKKDKVTGKVKKHNKEKHIEVKNSANNTLNTTLPTTFSLNDSKITSTPNLICKPGKSSSIKSIMKKKSVEKNVSTEVNETTPSPCTGRRKKRNKSVSFKLDENDEVVVKKPKSVDIESDRHKNKGKKPKIITKLPEHSNNNEETKIKIPKKHRKTIIITNSTRGKIKLNPAEDSIEPNIDCLKLNKHNKKKNNDDKEQFTKINDADTVTNMSLSSAESATEKEAQTEKKVKKKKNSKHKHTSITEVTAEGEPEPKLRKKDIKVIAEDLENLSIGVNTHTISNLLDEMTVVDKNKKKKLKVKSKKQIQSSPSASSNDTMELEKIEEGTEKVKWKKRKWNKDKKGEMPGEDLLTSVIVENLPLKIMMTYRKVVADHFAKCGLIKKIGIAEVYPTEDPKPVFTTTIHFYSEGAASLALEEDNNELSGNRIHVKRPLPPTQTTVVVRSYAGLTDQGICSAFVGCGKIRNIRHVLKGKKSICTAFVELDGPESVERALQTAAHCRVQGKKMNVSRFEVRGRTTHNTPQGETSNEVVDSSTVQKS